MKNNKSSIIGFVLMTLVFVAYMIYANYQGKKQLEAQQTVEKREVPAKTEAQQPTTTPNKTVSIPSELVNGADKESVFEVSNDVIKVEFTTRGAQMRTVTLLDKDYTKFADKKEDRTEQVKLFAPSNDNFNMSYILKASSGKNAVSTKEYNFEHISTETLENKKVVTMRLNLSNGSSIDHIYTIYDEKRPERDYMVDFQVKLNDMAPLMANQNSIHIDWKNLTYKNERSFENENNYTTLAYHFPGENEVDNLGISKEAKSDNLSASVDWISFKQQFFSSALICNSATLRQPAIRFNTEDENSGYIKNFNLSTSVEYTPQTTQYDFAFYLGPNKFSILKELKNNKGESLEMERIIPLGWVLSTYISRWVVIPLFDIMQSWDWNIGLIILLLTLIVKLAIFPLTYKSYLSTAKMRVIKPEIDALNAKYPRQEDAMKKQQEMMALYKKAGVSPMGGCLPMLIQMPILIAMFRFFPASIELRGQSFLWSQDLSSYDSILDFGFNIPFYGNHISLFCLLMVIVMFIYSYINYKLQGSSQPQMAGMKFMTVYMMPVMMLFWFNDYASGLCYYYLLSNLITILQTTIIRYSIDDTKIRLMMDNNAKKNTKGKKSRFQQRYEELLKQAEAQQKKK